jgi:chitin synthase
MPDDAATEHTHDASLMPQLGYFGESVDNLLLTRNADGTNYLGANSGDGGYGGGGLNTPRADKVPAPYAEADAASGWSEWNKASGAKSPVVPEKTKEGGDGLVVHNAPNTVEEVPTSRTRRI